jgi:RNase P subunit RPR2
MRHQQQSRPRRAQQAERGLERISGCELHLQLCALFGLTGGPASRRRWQCTCDTTASAGDDHSSSKSCRADYSQHNHHVLRELCSSSRAWLFHFLARRTWCRECSTQLTSGPSRTIRLIRADQWNQHTEAGTISCEQYGSAVMIDFLLSWAGSFGRQLNF